MNCWMGWDTYEEDPGISVCCCMILCVLAYVAWDLADARQVGSDVGSTDGSDDGSIDEALQREFMRPNSRRVDDKRQSKASSKEDQQK
jgi:hypothetical protein